MTTPIDPATEFRVSQGLRLTPVIPIPRPIDEWHGGAGTYEDAWHWEWGTVFFHRRGRIDITFAKQKCEGAGVSREFCRNEFMNQYPGGIPIDDEHHDTLSVRYYTISSADAGGERGQQL